ncbi:hypothetical protein VNI00_008560 [Paramarasmius palmivorus]|uniref:CoA-binding domain-containing protein n=1 Tax=Paramarasmius palmivorus TaxID=297713 RepID=A0AAW0CTH2_9AGAR
MAATAFALQKTFFAQPFFAVVGASQSRTKFGNKVLRWFQDREFLVQPTNPITLDILRQAKALSIPSIWLQPGSEDASVIEFIKENGMSDSVVFGGPCVLKDGDKASRSLF